MADARFKGYKNRGLNAQEMRRRREEEGVQIRKSKREEEVVNTDSTLLKNSLMKTIQ